MTEAQLLPPTEFVAVPYNRPTGQKGLLRLLPSSVLAIGEIGPENCAVLIGSSSDWLTINLSADELMVLLGATMREVST